MHPEPSPNPPPARRRSRLRRLGRWIFWAAVVLVVFHRPLVHVGGRWFAIHMAKREHMDLDLRIGGNVWTGLELRNVSIRADGRGPALIERMTLDRVTLGYDLRRALRGDWYRVLRVVDVGTLNGVVVVPERDPRKPREAPTPIAKLLGDILRAPFPGVRRLNVGRVDLAVKGLLDIRGFSVASGEGQAGFIAWEKVEIPGLPPLGAARAELVAGPSKIAVVKLPLFPQVALTGLTLNRATDAMPRGGLEVLAEAGGGTVAIRIEPSVTEDAIDLTVDAESVRVHDVAIPFRVELPVPAFIDRFHAKFTGMPERIDAGTGDVMLTAHSDAKLPFPAVTLQSAAKWERGVLKLAETKVATSGIDVRVEGELRVPRLEAIPAGLDGEITWTISGPDLTVVQIAGVPTVRGGVTGGGAVRMEKGVARVTGEIEATALDGEGVQVDGAKVRLDGQRRLGGFEDVLAGLKASLSVDVRGIAVRGVRMDSATVRAGLDGHSFTVGEISMSRGDNRVSGKARGEMKAGGAGLAQAAEIEAIISAPKLEQFGIMANRARFSGAIAGAARVRLDETQIAGNFQADGLGLRLGKASLGEFHTRGKFVDGAAVVDSLSVRVADAGEITASGRMRLDDVMAYTGDLAAKLPNLAKLDALLEAIGQPAKLGGSLNVEWRGEGQMAGATHLGKLTVAGRKIRRDNFSLTEMRVAAVYSPQQAETTELMVSADKLRIGGHLGWKEGRLDLSDLAVSVAGADVVAGRVSIPLNPANSKGVLPAGEALSAGLSAKNVDIGRMASSFGIAAPVTGTVSFNLAASGTLAKPDVKFTMEARSLKSAKAASLAPADVDVRVRLADGRCSVELMARQRNVQPFTIDASIPINLERLVREPARFRDLPLQVRARMPATALGIIPRFVPAVARLDGTASVDVEVGGTVAKPSINGEVSVAIKSLRMADENAPAVANISSKILLRGSVITLANTRGEIGGGTFGLDGSVNIGQLVQPILDLRLKSSKVLVLRDESITVRADADVTVKGPLNAALAAGTVYVTQSKFYKDVDILPLALPGRPMPKVKSVAAPMRISFPKPPLRDWKFDIVIRTREKDSFLILGNLAKGSAAIDLRLGGTGLNPFLAGRVEIEKFSAILPASTLVVRRGFVTFSPEEPFQPRLDVQAESLIRKNTVRASITGSATAPRLELESEPPLSQADILSLLATGTTTGEVGSNVSALATKAALLTVKRWYRKAFPGKASGNENETGEESLLERFEMDVGNVDPKTGRPDMTGSVRINDNLYFLGDIDMKGQFTGRVKYVLRFR